MPSGAVGAPTAGHYKLMTAGLLKGAATFRFGLGEKLFFVLLNQIDLVLTVSAVGLGFSELNPFMKNLLSSPWQLLSFKLAIPLLIAWLVPPRLLLPAIVLLLFVVGWDAKELIFSYI